MAEGPGFDLSKLTTSKKIVGGAAIVYVIWVFIPSWYSCCSVGGFNTAAFGGSSGVNGFRFPMILAWLLALVAIAAVVLTAMGTEMKMQMKTGTIQLGVAAAGLVLTVLGLVVKPSFTSLSWGTFAGIIIAAIWTYGAFMWHNEPEGGVSGGSTGLGS